MEEIYKDVIGYEGLYQVSNLGIVYRVDSNIKIPLKPINNGHNYMTVGLCKNGVKIRKYIHRIVASAFIENHKSKPHVNHIDGIRTNNKLENLEWVTISENHNHRYQVLKQRGVNYGKTGALNWNSKPVNKIDPHTNLIVCTYPGVMEASRILNVKESSIRSAIYGKSKTCLGYKWEYVNN